MKKPFTNSFAFGSLFREMTYPAGEPHIQLGRLAESQITPGEHLLVHCSRIRDFNGLCQILTGNDILERNGITATWFIPYFPFGRHDRRNHSYDGFELGVALDIIKDLDVVTMDPHSDVLGQLKHIPQSEVVRLYWDFYSAYEFGPDNNVVFVIPDAGATKKAMTWMGDREFVQCYKERDPKTGELSNFRVGDFNLLNRDCVIVDDICDGGGTFIGLAKELRVRGAKSVSLFVSHGLFTKGTDQLYEHLDFIFAPQQFHMGSIFKEAKTI